MPRPGRNLQLARLYAERLVEQLAERLTERLTKWLAERLHPGKVGLRARVSAYRYLKQPLLQSAIAVDCPAIRDAIRAAEAMGKKHKKHKRDYEAACVTDVEEQTEKPLRLVLKVVPPLTVDTSVPDDSQATGELTHARHHERRKKKKRKAEKEKEKEKDKGKEARDKEKDNPPPDDDLKKKKKKKREKEDGESEVEDEFCPPKKVEVDTVSERPLRACRNKDNVQELSPLQQLLDHLQLQLQRKDPHSFFAFPVTDVIAPGYSMIIKHPMDFSTMREKVERNDYRSLAEFKVDFKLMCDNAMTYNRPETIYYKAAKKLLNMGIRLMSKEKLLLLRRTMVFMQAMDEAQEAAIYRDDDCSPAQSLTASERTSHSPLDAALPCRKARKSSSNEAVSVLAGWEHESSSCSFTDSTAEADILGLVEQAADEAQERLRATNPQSKIGCLHRDLTGGLSLAVINSEQEGHGEEVCPVNVGVLLGKFQPSLAGFQEEKRSKLVPTVGYLNCTSLKSNPSQYSSLLSDLDESSSELLFSTYGEEAAIQYALSLQEFVNGCGEYAARVVDNLLDAFTGGDHSKTLRVLEEKRRPLVDGMETKLPEETGNLASDIVENADTFSSDVVDFASFEMSLLSSFGKEKDEVERCDSTQADRVEQKLPSLAVTAAVPAVVNLAGSSQCGHDAVEERLERPLDLVPSPMQAHDATPCLDEQSSNLPSLETPSQLSQEDQDDIDRELREFLEMPGTSSSVEGSVLGSS
uniref:bromodomain-containing protein 9-like n=1 Tax=Myxine glutinosa TaxID=7769 RepID=UPI00358E8406